ncbi:MAG TPA: hypothetical protein VK327_15265, partial [Candidatus Paceibacterota bacterium]|nr:hypothetical protein [Candidatus Paceibacterota bacterium]
VHDQADMAVRTEDFLQAARELDSRLSGIENGPLLFIEYAAGIKPATFAAFFNSIRNLSRVSACIDVGHVGIFQVRRAYSRTHPKDDVCALKAAGDRLSLALPEVQAAVDAALPEVLKLIDVIGRLGKPLHFHLHDGHPLSRFSPFGVSDHLSFFEEIPLDAPVRGRRSLPTMFGPAGLSGIVSAAMNTPSAEDISFTLEIHPRFERLPLGDAEKLFAHWRDKTNAEQMNHWLDVLRRNHTLLRNSLPPAH